MKTSTKTPNDIDKYIAGFPAEVQKTLQRIRVTIRKAAPDAEETIKYQMPTFVLHGNLIHFGAYKKHIGIYPVPRGVPEFKDDLAVYDGEKSTARFPLDEKIPYELITRIVKFRVKNNVEKAGAKKQKR